MAEEPSDAELLARHTAGDPDAFGLLVHRHRDRLWAVAVRTLGDREEAADALQDAMVSAFRAAAGFQGRSAVTTWLHRIVVNACLDRARRGAVRRAESLDQRPDGTAERALGAAEDAENHAVRAETRREVADALAELPADQRAALVLVDMQGYPVAEAAEVLGVPVGTVKSRCARGRARLLPLLRHLGPAGVPRETPPDARSAGVPRGTPSTGHGHPAGVPRGTSPGAGPAAVPRGTPPATPAPAPPAPRVGNPNRPSPVPPTDPSPALEGDATPR
ncbi:MULTISPECIES: RNA polymerase sigma factor SigM [Kitasatospora]|uniref:Putative RNA polymerase ECF subfamily sigma factor n=1 Tax=Kitasatospora setae (strain ATCC 33774 / DSM 43861 / JCM 3304 / KCC A-0304 / NBRC 14216 / KM-6054) TaxID=452652 RepID=E4MZC8_KITSK|nr:MULTISPECIES: RNA polymerase sigma factor SigM [Kitasatospora]BAJ29702.1 putative RNA polymerase ECF subfamily sigma factor [Kitasatospora setae KM-6054]